MITLIYSLTYSDNVNRIVKKNREKKAKEKQEKKGSEKLPGNVKASSIDRKHLHNYRVVQRNLVYVIGLPSSWSSEELLRRAEYFGQYGRIAKVVVHRTHTTSHSTVSAYVTFVHKEDAKASIAALDGHWVEGHPLRASFGTTKYCNNFIRNMACNNPDCVYLHEFGDEDDRFTKEEIQVLSFITF
jgi:CCR4-NOT transcription complex subunit 4